MKRLLYLLPFVLVIGAILWFLPADKPSPSAPFTQPSVQSTAPESKEPVASVPPEIAGVPLVDDRSSEVQGDVILLETGEGIEGAKVKVTIWGEDGKLGETKEVTDSDGHFAVASSDAIYYTIEVSYAGLVSEEPRYRVTEDEDEPMPEVVIWMIPGGAISGLVYDSVTNEGIAGVKVGLNRKQTQGIMTDADGRYRLEGLRDGKKRIFLGHAKGYIDTPENSGGVRVSVSLGQELSDVDFPLQRGVFAVIEGKVLNEQGNPVVGVEVEATRLNELTYVYESSSDETNADGMFQLVELQVAGGFFVAAKSEGYISEEIGPLGVSAEGIRDLVLTLRPTGSISGQVVDVNTGRPVAEPEFEVDTRYTSSGRNSIGGRSDNLDENGNFEILDLPPGDYGLFVDSSPNIFRTGIVRPQITVDLEHGQHIKDVRLTFNYERYLRSKAAREARSAEPVQRDKPKRPKVGEIHGQVVRAGTSVPVTSFNLRAIHGEMGSFSFQNVHDPDGRFTIKEERGQTLTIEITSNGYVPAQKEVPGGFGEQPVHDIVVPLQTGAVVDGEVVGISGDAVAGATVYIGVDPSVMNTFNPVNLIFSSDAVSGQDGSFRLDTLPETTMRIYASHPTFAVGYADVRGTVAGSTPLKIVLGTGGAIEGVVRRSGEPLAGNSIMVLDETGKNLKLSDNSSDNEGRFRVDRLAPGLYTLYTSIDDHSRTQYIEAEVAEGLITDVDFVFDETGNEIVGTVLLDGEHPFSVSVRVEIQTASGLEKINRGTARGAEYNLGNLPLGEAEVSVYVRHSDGSSARESFTVSITGGVIRRDFDLHTGE